MDTNKKLYLLTSIFSFIYINIYIKCVDIDIIHMYENVDMCKEYMFLKMWTWTKSVDKDLWTNG